VQTFVYAVTDTFAQPNHPLRYSWLDYVPDSGLVHIWKGLRSSILTALSSKPVLQTWELGIFKVPASLRLLPEFALHEDEPILPDLPEEVYLARKYSHHNIQVLRDLGLQDLRWSELLDRLSYDIGKMTSKLKTTPMKDPWHTSFARLFEQVFLENSLAEAQQKLKTLPIIPLTTRNQLTDKHHFQCGESKVYFPYFENIRIPDSLSLQLLDTVASLDPTRKRFYKALGVEECSGSAFLFLEIKKAQEKVSKPRDAVEQIHCLFQLGRRPVDIKKWLKMPATDGYTYNAYGRFVYFPSDNKYDMYRLHPESYMVKFLSNELVNRELPTIRVKDQIWRTWLAEITGARYYPPLADFLDFIETSDRGALHSLSFALEDVLNHNPTKFIGTLRAHWTDYQQHVHLVKSKLRACKVPCKSGSLHPLHSTYLPTSELLAKLAELEIPDTVLPLLLLPDSVFDDSICKSWMFLVDEVDVQSKPDMSFYKQVLEYMASLKTAPVTSKVADIYRCMADLPLTDSEQEDLW
jgi:hypothetical protein